VFKVGFQVDYADTDAMAVAHHASYFRWFERARVEWLRHLGLSYFEMEREGYLLPLRSAEIKYRKPLRFDDRPEVEVWVEKLRAAGIDLGYNVWLNGEIVTSAQTSHVLVLRPTSGEGMSPVKIPEKWRKVWQEQSAKKPLTSR